VNLDTQWCYIGKHKSRNPNNDEGYLGSCGNDHYWNSRQHHEFKCIILQYFENEELLESFESNLLSEELISKYSENGLFNLTTGGNGSTYYMNLPEVKEYAEKRRQEFFLEYNRNLYGDKANCCSHMQDPETQRIAHERSKEALTERNKELFGENSNCMTHLHTDEMEWKALLSRIFNSINKELQWYKDEGADKLDPFIFWSWSENWNLYHHIANVLQYLDILRSDKRWTSEMENIYPFFLQFYENGKINGSKLRSAFNC